MNTRALSIPDELQPRRLRRRALGVVAALGVLGLIAALAPGLGEVRELLAGAAPGWILVAVVLELLSSASYVLLFRPVFCERMTWRSASEIGLSELAVGSILPASGAGGLALGAWILSEQGMEADRIARRSVAFFLIKSSVNFVAVVVLGLLLAAGALGSDLSLALTALPAALAFATIAGVVALPRIGPGRRAPAGAGRTSRALAATRRAVVSGARDAREIFGRGEPLLLMGAVGYWAFDNAVLWAAFKAFGDAPALEIVLMGYLIGQLGGLLPLPGGVGGIDAGLLGTLVVYGAPAAPTAAAVLAYRLVLFWVPLLIGGAAFASLRRGLNRPDRPDLCPEGLSSSRA